MSQTTWEQIDSQKIDIRSHWVTKFNEPYPLHALVFVYNNAQYNLNIGNLAYFTIPFTAYYKNKIVYHLISFAENDRPEFKREIINKLNKQFHACHGIDNVTHVAMSFQNFEDLKTNLDNLGIEYDIYNNIQIKDDAEERFFHTINTSFFKDKKGVVEEGKTQSLLYFQNMHKKLRKKFVYLMPIINMRQLELEDINIESYGGFSAEHDLFNADKKKWYKSYVFPAFIGQNLKPYNQYTVRLWDWHNILCEYNISTQLIHYYNILYLLFYLAIEAGVVGEIGHLEDIPFNNNEIRRRWRASVNHVNNTTENRKYSRKLFGGGRWSDTHEVYNNNKHIKYDKTQFNDISLKTRCNTETNIHNLQKKVEVFLNMFEIDEKQRMLYNDILYNWNINLSDKLNLNDDDMETIFNDILSYTISQKRFLEQTTQESFLQREFNYTKSIDQLEITYNRIEYQKGLRKHVDLEFEPIVTYPTLPEMELTANYYDAFFKDYLEIINTLHKPNTNLVSMLNENQPRSPNNNNNNNNGMMMPTPNNNNNNNSSGTRDNPIALVSDEEEDTTYSDEEREYDRGGGYPDDETKEDDNNQEIRVGHDEYIL